MPSPSRLNLLGFIASHLHNHPPAAPNPSSNQQHHPASIHPLSTLPSYHFRWSSHHFPRFRSSPHNQPTPSRRRQYSPFHCRFLRGFQQPLPSSPAQPLPSSPAQPLPPSPAKPPPSPPACLRKRQNTPALHCIRHIHPKCLPDSCRSSLGKCHPVCSPQNPTSLFANGAKKNGAKKNENPSSTTLLPKSAQPPRPHRPQPPRPHQPPTAPMASGSTTPSTASSASRGSTSFSTPQPLQPPQPTTAEFALPPNTLPCFCRPQASNSSTHSSSGPSSSTHSSSGPSSSTHSSSPFQGGLSRQIIFFCACFQANDFFTCWFERPLTSSS